MWIVSSREDNIPINLDYFMRLYKTDNDFNGYHGVRGYFIKFQAKIGTKVIEDYSTQWRYDNKKERDMEYNKILALFTKLYEGSAYEVSKIE